MRNDLECLAGLFAFRKLTITIMTAFLWAASVFSADYIGIGEPGESGFYPLCGA